MRKILLLSFIVLVVVSCDLLFNKDSGSSSQGNDVAISSLTVSPSATRGETLEVEVQVKNLGVRDVNDEITITLTDQTEDTLIGTRTIENGLARNDSLKLSYSWDTGEVLVGEHTLMAVHDIEDDNAANDSLESTLTVNEPDITDLSISSINAPAMVSMGETVDVEVTLKNVGNQDITEEVTVTLNDDTQGAAIGTQSFSEGIASNDSTTLTFSWDTDGVSTGKHSLIASHEFSDENSSNNTQTETVTVNEAPVADIAISSLDVQDTATEGDIVNVSITVENIGNKDAEGDFQVTLTDQTDGDEIAKQTITEDIPSGNSEVLSFQWNTEGASIGDHTLEAIHNFEDENPDNDSRIAEITINEVPVPDLAITKLDVTDEATEGDEVDVSVTVENIGNKDAEGDFQVTLTDQTDGDEIAKQTISDGLASGSKVVISATWDTDGASIGDHTLEAIHNFDDENSDNDSRTAEVTINEAPVTDVAVTKIEAPESAKEGDKVDVSVTVKNQGNQNLGDPLEVTLTDQTDGSTIGTKTVGIGDLKAGNTETVIFSWDTKGASRGDHTLSAAHNLDDSNNGNNSRTKKVFIENIDLAIESIDGPSSANQDEKVEITVRLKNGGNRNIGSKFEVTLTDEKDNKTIGTEDVNGLSQGDATTVTFTWDTKDASLGDHRLVASHDLNDDNSGNDSRSTTVTVNEPPFIDLSIESINSPSSANQGDNVDVSVQLRNEGNRDIDRNFKITLTDDKDETTIGTKTINGLDEGDAKTVSFIWDTDEVSLGKRKLIAAHDLDDDENNNNTRSSDEIEINEAPFFDIIIKEIKAPEQRRRGEEVDVEVELKNEGNRDVNQKIIVTLRDQTDGNTIGVMELDDGLEKGKSVKLEFEWDTEEASFGNHTLIARHNFNDDKSDNDSASTEVFLRLF